MKMIYITANVSVLPELMSILEKADAQSYQIIEKASAKPSKGQKRMDNAVWPGYNVIVFVQAEDTTRQILEKLFAAHNQAEDNDNEMIFWTAWQLEKSF